MKNGFVWDRNGEYYGAETPPMTYEEVQRVLPEIFGGGIVDPAMQAKYDAFEALLKAQNDFSDAKFIVVDVGAWLVVYARRIVINIERLCHSPTD